MFHLLLASASSLLAATAWADDEPSRWSLGMQIGQARGSAESAPVTPAQEFDDPTTLSYDVTATLGGANRFGWRVFTGYRFTNYLAIQVGYTDLGKSETRLVDAVWDSARMPSFERVGTEAVRGVDVALQLKVPVTGRIDVEVRGGQFYWQSDTRIPGSWSEFPRTDYRSSKSDSDAFFGAGVEVSVMNDLSATLGWTRYNVGAEPVGLWTVGALYRFGIY